MKNKEELLDLMGELKEKQNLLYEQYEDVIKNTENGDIADLSNSLSKTSKRAKELEYIYSKFELEFKDYLDSIQEKVADNTTKKFKDIFDSIIKQNNNNQDNNNGDIS